MRYTQEAAVKSHNSTLRKFIKYIDYMLLDTKCSWSALVLKKLVQRIR